MSYRESSELVNEIAEEPGSTRKQIKIKRIKEKSMKSERNRRKWLKKGLWGRVKQEKLNKRQRERERLLQTKN